MLKKMIFLCIASTLMIQINAEKITREKKALTLALDPRFPSDITLERLVAEYPDIVSRSFAMRLWYEAQNNLHTRSKSQESVFELIQMICVATELDSKKCERGVPISKPGHEISESDIKRAIEETAKWKESKELLAKINGLNYKITQLQKTYRMVTDFDYDISLISTLDTNQEERPTPLVFSPPRELSPSELTKRTERIRKYREDRDCDPAARETSITPEVNDLHIFYSARNDFAQKREEQFKSGKPIGHYPSVFQRLGI